VPLTRTVTTLRTFRERAGLSQVALAEQIGV
jgi:DNA-binding XRE family transcriptional regulator